MPSPIQAHEEPKKSNFLNRLAESLSKSKPTNATIDPASSTTDDTRPPSPPSNPDFLRRKNQALLQYGLVSTSAKHNPGEETGEMKQGGGGPSSVRRDWPPQLRNAAGPCVPMGTESNADPGRGCQAHHNVSELSGISACDDGDCSTSTVPRPSSLSSESSYAPSTTCTLSIHPAPPHDGIFDRDTPGPLIHSNERLVAEMDRVKRENPGDKETQRLTEIAFFS